MGDLVVLETLQGGLVRLQAAVTLEKKGFILTCWLNIASAHLQEAALQVNPESVARSITSDLRMNPLNAHCIVKLYNIYIGITSLQK